MLEGRSEGQEIVLNAFIDFDNLLTVHKQAGILQILTKALVQVCDQMTARRARCDARIYGGWYEGSQMTRMAQELTIQLQNDFPAIVRVPVRSGQVVPVMVNAELAMSLLQEPGHHLFDSFRRRRKPGNLRIPGQGERDSGANVKSVPG